MKFVHPLKIRLFKISGLAGALFLTVAVLAQTTNTPPKYTTEEIMKAVYKGDDSAHKKITKGVAAPADYDKLVEYLSALPLNDPPQGDVVEWRKRSTALLDAAIALKAQKPDALSQYNKAVNCQACHRIYRPD